MWQRMSLSWAAPFAEHFTVYLVNRRAGLAPGATMADIAADYAGAIVQDIGRPVMLHGLDRAVPVPGGTCTGRWISSGRSST